MRTVVGVDPGSRTTGLAVVRGTTLVAFDSITHDGPVFPASTDYLRAVAAAVDSLIETHSASLLAVETLREPNWHVGGGRAAARPGAVIATCAVVGGLQMHDFDVPLVMVPPGKHGKGYLGSYPEELVGPGERRRPDWRVRTGTGALRHARSAFDVARNGNLIYRAEGAHHS
ncbi:RuvC-like resolvase [Gordonia phage Morgana]|uniref:RuvC-like resolvase n=1 Tax=Gordonia phage Morgana TaxID=3137292 RepID=A0AAX4RBA0_9CAUD